MRLFAAGWLLVALALFAAGCAGDQTGADITDRASFEAALEAAGATIVPAGEIAVGDSFFPVGAQIIELDGQSVQVYEFADEEAAAAAAATVSAEGGTIGTSIVEWIDTPHFFRSGRLIVLYVGDDAATLSLLADALGEEFAGGAPSFGPPAS